MGVVKNIFVFYDVCPSNVTSFLNVRGRVVIK